MDIADDRVVIDMHFECKSFRKKWISPSLFEYEDNPGKEGDFPSFVNFSSIPIFSEKACDVLNLLIGKDVEYLPVKHPRGKKYYMVNIMKVLDCVDHEKSDYGAASDGTISRVYSYKFLNNVLEDNHFFKTPLKSGADLLFDDDFREQIERHNLEGLFLERVVQIS